MPSRAHVAAGLMRGPARAPAPGWFAKLFVACARRMLAEPTSIARASIWSLLYGDDHKPVRVDIEPDMATLHHARVYRRSGHYRGEVWDPRQKRTVHGGKRQTLAQAIADAIELDRQVIELRTTGRRGTRLGHEALVEKYVDGLRQRAEAGEIKPGTPVRYESALRRHYLAFARLPEIAKRYLSAVRVDGRFVQEFGAYLDRTRISPNGHENTKERLMQAPGFVLDAARAMFEWARDPQRGALLPERFVNPFLGASRHAKEEDELDHPLDITTDMAVAFVEECDEYQLRLFVPLIGYGLRASEPRYLFREYLTGDALRVICNKRILYATKGKRNKTLPIPDPIRHLLDDAPGRNGLLYRRREVEDGKTRPPLWSASLETIVTEFDRRCREAGEPTRPERIAIRDGVLKDAGALSYDNVNYEFRKIARRLRWQKEATVKDFRHLFSTTMMVAGMPDPMRQFLMGHSLGKSPIRKYTHLDLLEIREAYMAAVEKKWPVLLAAIEARAVELGLMRPRRTAARVLKGTFGAGGSA